MIVHPDGYIVTDPRRKRCAAAARRYPAAGHRRLDSRGAKPHRRRSDCRHRSRNGPRGNQVDGRSLATPAVRQCRRSAHRSTRPVNWPARLDNSVSLGVVSAVARQLDPSRRRSSANRRRGHPPRVTARTARKDTGVRTAAARTTPISVCLPGIARWHRRCPFPARNDPDRTWGPGRGTRREGICGRYTAVGRT